MLVLFHALMRLNESNRETCPQCVARHAYSWFIKAESNLFWHRVMSRFNHPTRSKFFQFTPHQKEREREGLSPERARTCFQIIANKQRSRHLSTERVSSALHFHRRHKLQNGAINHAATRLNAPTLTGVRRSRVHTQLHWAAAAAVTPCTANWWLLKLSPAYRDANCTRNTNPLANPSYICWRRH